VQARLAASVIDEFEAWHAATHLPHVLQIPGIVAARRVRRPSDLPGTHIMLYEFRNESAVQPALASAQAQLARRDWDRWHAHLEELSIEIYAPLGPIETYHHRN
jgi:hypothetical protein